MNEESLSGHLQELRRGTIVVACLSILGVPGYGYSLLEQLNAAGFSTDASTLYPLLRRLEKQGYLSSNWNTDEARPRKFYLLTPDGRELLDALRSDWNALSASLGSLDTTTNDDLTEER